MNLSEDNLIELLQSVARIEQKLDGIADLEPRVRTLEARWAWIAGGIAVLSAIWAYIVKKLLG